MPFIFGVFVKAAVLQFGVFVPFVEFDSI